MARSAIINIQNKFVLTVEVHVYDYLGEKPGSMDWLKAGHSEDRGSIPGNGSDICILHNVQIGSASYPTGKRGDFPRDWNVKLRAHLRPLLRLKCVDRYLYSCTRLHGVVLN
jgi:hypothetical protein